MAENTNQDQKNSGHDLLAECVGNLIHLQMYSAAQLDQAQQQALLPVINRHAKSIASYMDIEGMSISIEPKID